MRSRERQHGRPKRPARTVRRWPVISVRAVARPDEGIGPILCLVFFFDDAFRFRPPRADE